jgi:DNA-binding transcriptional ArsR family regulator
MFAMVNFTESDSCVAQLADLFHLLGDPTRLRIVLACVETPIAVSEIAGALQLSSSLVSHHLRLLRAARIVKAERHGKQVFYSAADAHISDVLTDMLEHIAEPTTGIEA